MRFVIGITALALVASLAACGISKEVYQRDVDEWRTATERCQAEKRALEERHAEREAEVAKQIEQLEAEKGRCLAELSRVMDEKGTVSAELDGAIEQLEQMRAIAARQKKTLDAIMSGLQSMVSAGTIKVVQRNGRLVVEIAESILFDSGKSAIKAGGKEALAQIAPVLAGVNREFQIAGHTDNVGAEAFNWRLSVDRALNVHETMRDAGYPASRLSAAGYAWYQPVASNDAPEGRQLNRRVDIVLVPNLEELRMLPEVSAAPACGRYLAAAR